MGTCVRNKWRGVSVLIYDATPLKIDMQAKREGLEDEFPVQTGDLIFQGVLVKNFSGETSCTT